MPGLYSRNWARLCLLMAATSNLQLAALAQLDATKSGSTGLKRPFDSQVLSQAQKPLEIGPAETTVVQPDGVGVSGSGYASPAQVSGGKPAHHKKVKASDIAHPGTAAYAVREFEQKTQKEFFQQRQGLFSELKDSELARVFDAKLKWTLLRYPIWPLAMAINPPLQSNNVFVLDEKNKIVAHISDLEKLKKFCEQFMHPVKTEQDAKVSLLAYLRLQQELAQDGMFQFGIKQDSIKISNSRGHFAASGRSTVAPNTGNQGYLETKLVFGSDGRLLNAESVNKLQEGMRPICQSTKLLDPDPIVRKMAEQDILIMGSSCKFYLDEMRTRSKPEIRDAIDRIWKQIEKREAERGN